MIDVSRKSTTLRSAIARSRVTMSAATLAAVREGRVPKGDPLTVAKIAAVQAAKNTSQLIPFCHPLPIDFVGVAFTYADDAIEIQVEVKAIWKTGVEMEALTGAAIAALTIYDMLKMLEDGGGLRIEHIELISKTGGKSDYLEALGRTPRAAVLVLSDSVAGGTKRDTSGKAIESRLASEGIDVIDYSVIPDEKNQIEDRCIHYADVLGLDLVVTTGGTGLSPTDHTPEAMKEIFEREVPGIPEALRMYGQERTPFAMLTRGMAGQRGRTLIVNLPGSIRGVSESLDALFPALHHAIRMIGGTDHARSESESLKADKNRAT